MRLFTKKRIIWIALSIILILVATGAFVAGYYLAKPDKTSPTKQTQKTLEALKELQHLVDTNIHNTTKPSKKITIDDVTRLQQPTNKSPKITKLNSEAIDYTQNSNETEKEPLTPILVTNKPKLVIIMDDVSFKSEVNKIKALHINITPSFFPPSYLHPYTPKYAKEFKYYMVHFPMQATNPNFKEEVNTIHTNSNIHYISTQIANLKAQFPRAHFINNHTGSKFTASYDAMNRLYQVLQQYHILFVDSKTTSHSKARLLARKYHMVLFSRDVFLDNKPNIQYIRHQLKQAIRIAHKRGYAIAICHPHPKTFEALAKSKDLLRNVEVIYIDELYKLYKNHKLSKL
ncbi:MAG: divergent polysaccharide deacetylase family protein [Epsilonproteobacteria bacterium]|nr:divergent polysaccharide deacetylase family protein [Campylobacterota bacterium]